MSAIHITSPNALVIWDYPESTSTLVVDICHVRVIDEVRLRFDFDSHQWVAEQELHAGDNPLGRWVEVARWSGNAPEVDP